MLGILTRGLIFSRPILSRSFPLINFEDLDHVSPHLVPLQGMQVVLPRPLLEYEVPQCQWSVWSSKMDFLKRREAHSHTVTRTGWHSRSGKASLCLNIIAERYLSVLQKLPVRKLNIFIHIALARCYSVGQGPRSLHVITSKTVFLQHDLAKSAPFIK